MEKLSKNMFLLLLLRIASLIFCHAVKVGDSCDQKGKPGAITLDEKCPYFDDLDYEERSEHSTYGFHGMNALICCKGVIPTDLTSRFDISKQPDVRETTQKNIFTTIDPINTNDGIESLCGTIGPYPGLVVRDRLIDGAPAVVGEFPHFASLAYRNKETNVLSFDCGGALISHKHVLTAAHCIKPKDKLEFVRLGAILRHQDNDDGHVDVPVENITKHPEYQPNYKYHDIAILKLQSEVTFSYFIWPACLSRNSTLHVGKSLTIAGFGRTSVTNIAAFSDHLLRANIEEVPLQECRDIYKRAYEGVTIKGIPSGIKDELMCARNTSSSADTCQGDSGTGLKFRFKKNYYIVGVTSFGIDCGSSLPSFYTRVSKYIDWIEEVLSS